MYLFKIIWGGEEQQKNPKQQVKNNTVLLLWKDLTFLNKEIRWSRREKKTMKMDAFDSIDLRWKVFVL